MVRVSLCVCARKALHWGVRRVSTGVQICERATLTDIRPDWLWNFLLSFFSPRIANDIGPLILLIFCGMLVFGYVYVYLFIPETKGLSLEEVDEMYRSRIPAWKSAGWRPSEKHIHDKVEAAEVHEVREKADDGESA